ncbi:MAG: VIT1/CCC1 transporter family protein [Candidatus Woesearchaeota archaeon]
MLHKEHHKSFAGTCLKDAVFGASDGIVTTFAVVAGTAYLI